MSIFSIFKKNGLIDIDQLYFPTEKFNWNHPWWNLEENPELRMAIQEELHKEVGSKHPLWGLQPVVFGKSDASDDVIVHLNDGRYACVHLVWHGEIDNIPDVFPGTVFYKNAQELQKALNGS